MRMILSIVLSSVLLVGCGGGSGGGVCSVARSGRIAGGSSCDDGSTGVALVLVSNAAGEVEQCTGSYISLTSVLTAAHCFPGRVTEVAVGSNGNIKAGVSVAIHPLYDGSVSSPFDMAIIKVDSPLNGSVVPILSSRSPEAGERVIAYGYGLDQSGRGALDRVANGEASLKATRSVFAGYFSGTSALLSTGAGSTCSGDSGGPVLAKNSSGAYGIIGITRAGPSGCDAEKGRYSLLSSTESVGAANFISTYVPDAAVN